MTHVSGIGIDDDYDKDNFVFVVWDVSCVSPCPHVREQLMTTTTHHTGGGTRGRPGGGGRGGE